MGFEVNKGKTARTQVLASKYDWRNFLQHLWLGCHLSNKRLKKLQKVFCGKESLIWGCSRNYARNSFSFHCWQPISGIIQWESMWLPISANPTFHPGQCFNGTIWPKTGSDSKQPTQKWNSWKGKKQNKLHVKGKRSKQLMVFLIPE